MYKQSFITHEGFTLIEIIAVLAIIGILMISLARPFSNFISGFIMAQDASELEQKSLLALSRIEKELNLQGGIDSTSTTADLKFFPTVDSSGRTASTTAYSIYYNPDSKSVIFNDGVDYTLIDNISNFSVTYNNESSISLSTKIVVSFTCIGYPQPFVTTVALP